MLHCAHEMLVSLSVKRIQALTPGTSRMYKLPSLKKSIAGRPPTSRVDSVNENSLTVLPLDSMLVKVAQIPSGISTHAKSVSSKIASGSPG